MTGEQQPEKYFNYLEQIYCVDYEVMLAESIQPHAGTGNWLFESRQFVDWAQWRFSGICWLRGGAGFGKTVIARNMVENFKSRTDRAVSLSPFGSTVVLHYFFRQEKTETLSQNSFLRSILHQLLLASPQVWPIIYIHYEKTRTKAHDLQTKITFSADWMWLALEDILTLESSENALMIIDALDEIDSLEVTSVLSHLVGIINAVNKTDETRAIKILIFSRPSFYVEKSLSKVRVTTLEVEGADISKDIQAYVSDAVEEFGNDHEFPEHIVLKIKERVLNGADGMFLWAHLAWEHFKEGVHVWSTSRVHQQLELLSNLPKGLEKLYQNLLLKIDANARFGARTCLDASMRSC